jgi:uncharacterized lipoprotein YajG
VKFFFALFLLTGCSRPTTEAVVFPVQVRLLDVEGHSVVLIKATDSSGLTSFHDADFCAKCSSKEKKP